MFGGIILVPAQVLGYQRYPSIVQPLEPTSLGFKGTTLIGGNKQVLETISGLKGLTLIGESSGLSVKIKHFRL